MNIYKPRSLTTSTWRGKNSLGPGFVKRILEGKSFCYHKNVDPNIQVSFCPLPLIKSYLQCAKVGHLSPVPLWFPNKNIDQFRSYRPSA